MQQHYSKYCILPADPLPPSKPLHHILPTPDPGDGVDWSKCVFFIHVHVKLNGTTKCSNMVANILPADPKFNLFRTMSCCTSN